MTRRLALAAVLTLALVLVPWALDGPGTARGEHVHTTTPEAPPAGAGFVPPSAEYDLEPGFTLQLVSSEFTFPSAVALRENGEVYVTEAGYSYGTATALPRVLHVLPNGSVEEAARLPDGPLTGAEFHDDELYVIGGRAPAEVWRVDVDSGDVETVLTGFPVWGHHFTSQITFGPDDRMYFVVGYPSNAGVIGMEDYYEFQYLSIFPEARDVPCIRHVLAGVNFETPDPFTDDPDDRAVTGAFKKFGEPSEPGEVIEATPPPGCNGAVFSANPDGSDLDVYATGFRNPWGIKWSPDERLFLIDQGADNGGSRPIANDMEPMWEVEEGGWYGFPDYFSGFPVTMEGFYEPPHGPHEFVLDEHPPLAGTPFFLMVPSCGCMDFDFSPGGPFGFDGHAFVTQYGSQLQHDVVRGHRVIALDMDSRTPTDFYVNNVPGPNGTAPERPIDAAFTPDGSALYLLDFGSLNTDSRTFFSSPVTGGLWVITPEGVDPPVSVTSAGERDARWTPAPAAWVTLALLAGASVLTRAQREE